ncbi:MAG: hypothetical protein V1778_01655 [bacterium]
MKTGRIVLLLVVALACALMAFVFVRIGGWVNLFWGFTFVAISFFVVFCAGEEAQNPSVWKRDVVTILAQWNDVKGNKMAVVRLLDGHETIVELPRASTLTVGDHLQKNKNDEFVRFPARQEEDARR